MSAKHRDAARWLWNAHVERARFAPLPPELQPVDVAEAYRMQDAFVAAKREATGSGIAGYKIALTTPQMRAFTRFDDSIGGVVLDHQVLRSPAIVRTADFGRVLVECELAFELACDVGARAGGWDRAAIGDCIAAVMPAFEVADDRDADYGRIAADMLTLAVDNAWNEGAILGARVTDWRRIDLAAVRGVLKINGEPAGEGLGRDVLGHPLDAMAWIANHLAGRGITMRRGEFVITGSLVTSKFPRPGDQFVFEVSELGRIELQAT